MRVDTIILAILGEILFFLTQCKGNEEIKYFFKKEEEEKYALGKLSYFAPFLKHSVTTSS